MTRYCCCCCAPVIAAVYDTRYTRLLLILLCIISTDCCCCCCCVPVHRHPAQPAQERQKNQALRVRHAFSLAARSARQRASTTSFLGNRVGTRGGLGHTASGYPFFGHACTTPVQQRRGIHGESSQARSGGMSDGVRNLEKYILEKQWN